MTVTADIASRLAEAIGAKRVIAAAEELEAYAVDGAFPYAIVRPASADEAAEVVQVAIAEKLAVLALGSRSKCDVGMPPDRYDVALDMTALRGIAHYDSGDLTLSVDAGTSLRELEGYLKKHGQFLPLAVPCFESATVGGTVASGIDSAFRLQYGSVRDFLIGAEFIDGKGQLCKSGGRVVKNVTGYDLHKLLIGSLGTLGVVTRLNFKTFPLPHQFGGHMAGFEGCQGALEYKKAVEKSGLPLSNQEVLDPGIAGIVQAIQRRSEDAPAVELEQGAWHVYSSFEGRTEVVDRIGRDLQRTAQENGATENRILETEEDAVLGGMLRESFEWLRWASRANVIYRLALPRVDAKTLAELLGISETSSLRAALLVRAAGIVYFSLLAESDRGGAVESLAKTVAKVRAVAHTAGGHATMLHAPCALKKNVAGPLLDKMDTAMQQRAKQAFDPSDTFAPGRIAGGI
jgi:glycolate dehydrogenase FAD-binding subunit